MTYFDGSIVKGASFWSELPVSPKVILPFSRSGPKHMEKESGTSPFLAKVLGTDKLLIPSPSRPFGGKLPVGDEGSGVKSSAQLPQNDMV